MSFYALLQRLVDAWHAGDADAAASLFAQDAGYREAGREPLRGRAAIRDFMRGFFAGGSAVRMVVGDVLVDGETAFVTFTFAMRGAGGTARQTMEMGALVRFGDGYVTEWREYRA
ncbi:nuclear transport factor 2 family protein [bacterium]|nr:MAG: nuclear transport factor 2 family protein [bacterium]